MPPASYLLMWHLSPTMHPRPRGQWHSTEMRLPIVELGRKSAASFPNSAAARSCSEFTVGSSPHTSSPTAASAIALRMPSDGRVTVSLRKSAKDLLLLSI